MNPAKTEKHVLITYVYDLWSVKIKNNNEDIKYAMRIEIAAPRVPYMGTKVKKLNKNTSICTNPFNISIFDLPKLLSMDIIFIVIEAGIILIDSIYNTVSAFSYSGPIKESIDRGATSNATTIGAVKLRLILRLLRERSFINLDEDGITIYAMLEAKLLATIVIIKAI